MRFLLGAVFLATSLGATGVPPPQPAENKASVAARLHLVAVCPQISSECGVPTSAVAQIPDLVAALNCMLKVNISSVPAGDCHDALALLLSQHSPQVQADNSSSDSSDSSSSGETVPVTIEISSLPESLPFPFPFPGLGGSNEDPKTMLFHMLEQKMGIHEGSSDNDDDERKHRSDSDDDDDERKHRPHMPPMMGRPMGRPPMPFGGPEPSFHHPPMMGRPPMPFPHPPMMGPRDDDDDFSFPHPPMPFGFSHSKHGMPHGMPPAPWMQQGMSSWHSSSRHHSKHGSSRHHSKHGSSHMPPMGMPPMPFQHGSHKPPMGMPPMPYQHGSHKSHGMPPMPWKHSSSRHHSKHGSSQMPPMPWSRPPMPWHHSSHDSSRMPPMGMPPMPYHSSHSSRMPPMPWHHSSHDSSRMPPMPWQHKSHDSFGMWMQSDSSRPSFPHHGMPFPFPPSSHHGMPPFSPFGMSHQSFGGPQQSMFSRFSHGSKHHSKHSKRGMPFPPFGMSYGKSSHMSSMPPFMMGGSQFGMNGPMGRPPMMGPMGMNGPMMMGRPPMGGPMGRPPMMGQLPPIMPPLSLGDDSSYDYDASSGESTPNLLSTIIEQMMGGKPGIEITPVTGSSEEGSSGEASSDASVDSVEVSVEGFAPPAPVPEIAPAFALPVPHRGDGKIQRVPEEVSYRRAP